MKKEEIEAFALKASKGLKSQQDLLDFTQMLTKITVEAALNAELDEHLGYKYQWGRVLPFAFFDSLTIFA